jgi:hypothetical protein
VPPRAATVVWTEVLQLCSHPVVGWPDAPPGVFGLQSIQMASIRTGGHPHGNGMVFALLAFVPRRRGAIGRAWALGGSRHRWRWVQRYAPELERRLRKRLKATNDSWRVDETYVRVKGKWVNLYLAANSTGATIDFLLSAKRDASAAERFLTKALGEENHPAPRVINTDKHAAYPPAIVELKADGVLEEKCTHRPVQYLNNVLEQDHRAIKRRVRESRFGSAQFQNRLPQVDAQT